MSSSKMNIDGIKKNDNIFFVFWPWNVVFFWHFFSFFVWRFVMSPSPAKYFINKEHTYVFSYFSPMQDRGIFNRKRQNNKRHFFEQKVTFWTIVLFVLIFAAPICLWGASGMLPGCFREMVRGMSKLSRYLLLKKTRKIYANRLFSKPRTKLQFARRTDFPRHDWLDPCQRETCQSSQPLHYERH